LTVRFPTFTSITITKIGFWNAGNETIKKNEVVKDDPITIHAKEGVVFLSATIIEAVNPLNKLECTVSKDRSSVSLSFDYLDCNQGALIQLFHTGTADAEITMTGTIMGASRIKRFRTGNSQHRQPPLWAIAIMLCLSWILVGTLTTGVIPKDSPPEPPLVREPTGIPLEVAIIILTVATTVVITFWYHTYIPKPFSKVHDQ
jgi:hypothetical protein